MLFNNQGALSIMKGSTKSSSPIDFSPIGFFPAGVLRLVVVFHALFLRQKENTPD